MEHVVGVVWSGGGLAVVRYSLSGCSIFTVALNQSEIYHFPRTILKVAVS